MGGNADLDRTPDRTGATPGNIPGAPQRKRQPGRAAALYPNVYVWYVFFASLDIMLTWVVLHAGGDELNFLADRIIERWGLPGLVTFKFTLVMLVVGICEIVGRRHPARGRKLAEWAVAITVIPVAIALLQLVLHFLA